MKYTDFIHPRIINLGQYNMGLSHAWNYSRGTNIVAAVLSTGIGEHWSFNGQILDGRNFTSDNAGDINDFYEVFANADEFRNGGGHGTMIASAIAGKLGVNEDYTNDPEVISSQGTDIGTAPEAKLLIGKVNLKSGIGDTLQSTIDGINWATNWVGPNGEKTNIIVLDYYTTIDEPTYKTAIDAATDAGIIVICANADLKNNTATKIYPTGYSNVLSFLPTRADDFIIGSGHPDYTSPNTTISADVAVNSQVSVIDLTSKWGWYVATDPVIAAGAGAGVVAVLLQAYKEAETPITSKTELMLELPKYCRPLEQGKNSVAKSSLGTIYLNGDYKLPNEITTEYVEVPGETVYVDREVIVEVPGETIIEYVDKEVIVEVEVPGPIEYIEKIVYVSDSGELSNTILSQVPIDYMRKELKIPAHVDSDNAILATNMEIAKSFLIEETDNTLEELDAKPMTVGLFKRLVADLYYERMSTSEVKQSPVYKAMLNRLCKVVV